MAIWIGVALIAVGVWRLGRSRWALAVVFAGFALLALTSRWA